MDSLFQDVRFGLRILLRTPILTGAILLSLALGIGANTAMFSILDAVALAAYALARSFHAHSGVGARTTRRSAVRIRRELSGLAGTLRRASPNWPPGVPLPT